MSIRKLPKTSIKQRWLFFLSGTDLLMKFEGGLIDRAVSDLPNIASQVFSLNKNQNSEITRQQQYLALVLVRYILSQCAYTTWLFKHGTNEFCSRLRMCICTSKSKSRKLLTSFWENSSVPFLSVKMYSNVIKTYKGVL